MDCNVSPRPLAKKKKKKKCGLRIRRIAMEANFTAVVAFLTAWLDRTALADEDASASTGDGIPSVFLTYCLCRSQTTVPDWWCRGGWHRFQCTRQTAPLSLFIFTYLFIFNFYPVAVILHTAKWHGVVQQDEAVGLLPLVGHHLPSVLSPYLPTKEKEITFLLAS